MESIGNDEFCAGEEAHAIHRTFEGNLILCIMWSKLWRRVEPVGTAVGNFASTWKIQNSFFLCRKDSLSLAFLDILADEQQHIVPE
jgi:hypothetical protein